ncbi:hypothetical protein BU15DRAFT_77338 [Melanogaster broomeanus]|nr:hypothetical protein BU15DRAFT_77338 [Melanogaster broomeanus]
MASWIATIYVLARFLTTSSELALATPTPGFQTLRCFGGFTHHPNYAGDLIFGARTQVTSLWHALHADAHARTPCIDKIELASITLDNEAEIPHGTASATAAGETGVQKGDTEASLNVSSSLDLLAIASHNMEDIVDLSHPSPPTTPLTTSRSMHPHSHIHSSHGRSMSVPPSELWSTMARPTHVHGHSQPLLTMRSLPLFESLPLAHASESAPLHAALHTNAPLLLLCSLSAQSIIFYLS